MLRTDRWGTWCRVGVAGLAAIALAACGDDDGDSTSDESSRGSDTVRQVSPLTGLPAPDGLPKHPVVVVKIDNTSSATPQVGLSKADLVAEELVEGGSTRLAAFYWSNTPKKVGPVRSMRTSDVGIVSPTHGVLVASGGAPPTVKELARADVKTATEGPGYSRDPSRSAPYNLMVNLDRLTSTLQESEPPGPYLPFGKTKLAGAKPATSAKVTFSAGHTTQWSYEKGTGWVREGGLAAQGDDFVPDTVLALKVKVGDAGYRDPAGNPVPESTFYGTGKGVVFHQGKAIRCRWTKDDASGSLRLTTTDGRKLAVPRGHTWIELVPRDNGSISFSR